MAVRAVQGGTGRVRTGRIGPGTGGGGGVSPAFQADFIALSALPSGVSFSRATTGTYFNSSGVLQTAAIDAPRFDYAWNGAAWVAKGLLIEEQRTNLLPTSNPLTNAAWTSNAGATKAASGNNSPDGTTDATTVTPAAALGSFIYQGFTCSSTGTYTASIWARVTSGTGLAYLSLQDAGSGSTTSVACSLTTTWTMFQVSRTCTSGNTPFLLIGNSYTNADASASFEAFGGQIEAGAFATSYIPTTTVAVTRSADIAQLTGAAATALQGSAGSLLIQTERVNNWPAGCEIIQFKGAAGNDDLYTSSNTNARYYQSGDKITATLGSGSFAGGQARLGFSWDASGTSLIGSGGTAGTSATVLSTDTGMYLGSSGSNFFINGYINSLAIYTSRLSDADLQTKSVVGAAF